jgi:hypothetical protein
MPDWEKGVPYLIENIQRVQLLDAIELSELNPFLDLFVQRVLKSPDLLKRIDIDQPGAFSLWKLQLEKGGIFYPLDVEKDLFKNTLYKKLASDLPVQVFSRVVSETAGLFLQDSGASEVWNRLNIREKKELAKCAVQILSKEPLLLKEHQFVPRELKEALIDYLNTAYALSPEFILICLSKNVYASEWGIIAWLRKTNSSEWDQGSLKNLGGLIKANKWKTLLKELFKVRSTKPLFMPVVQDCSDLLDFWDSWRLGFYSGASKSVNKDVLVGKVSDIGSELAPSRLSYLWMRAGGEQGSLLSKGTNAEIWFHAVKSAEDGALPNGMADLVKALLDEFPNNEELLEVQKMLRRN